MNPAKDAYQLSQYPLHRIIMPVYIPHLEGYFEQMLEVLKISLNSLKETMPDHAGLTIISNKCAPEIETYLLDEYESGWIDQLIFNQQNRGKVDAIISAARASFCEIVTFTDCDVLFFPGWAEAVEEVFATFPEAGSVSPFPAPGAFWHETSTTIIGAFLKRILKNGQYVSVSDFELITSGIGRDPNIGFREKQWIVERENIRACIGGGHFTISFHRSVIDSMPKNPSLTAISNDSERVWLDQFPNKVGLWRLSTVKCHVYHIGNFPTQFPTKNVCANDETFTTRRIIPQRTRCKVSYLPYLEVLTRILRRVK